MTTRPTRRAWLARLFPNAWRARYEEEFLALLAECPAGLRDTLDILRSAADARLRPQAWLLKLELAVDGSPVPPIPIRQGDPPSRWPSRRFTRRTFLRNAVLGSIGVAAAGATTGALAFAWQNQTSPFGGEFVVPRAAIPSVGAPPYRDVAGKFYLMNNADGVLALYWKCPHLGCTVPWNEGEKQFHCPCHQSQYNRYGERTYGPAPRAMDLMALRFDAAGNAVVDTGQITERQHYEPGQAVQPLPPSS